MYAIGILLATAVTCVGGSVVECSPATRAARVRFPADAMFCYRSAVVGVACNRCVPQEAFCWLKKRRYVFGAHLFAICCVFYSVKTCIYQPLNAQQSRTLFTHFYRLVKLCAKALLDVVLIEYKRSDKKTKPDAGLEPATARLRVWCSTD